MFVDARCDGINSVAVEGSVGASKTRRFRISNGFTSASVHRVVPPPRAALPGPFAPTPLQGPHRYYGPVRPCAPHRYSPTRSVRCLWFSLSRPENPGRLYRGDRFSCSMPAPAMSSRHLYTGHRRGHIQAAPRLRAHRGEPLSRDHPQIPVSMPSLFRFDASAVVHTCSSSHRIPAPLTARRQPQRSPPRLLTDAACGGLESPPARRPRRTYLHHWHSTDRADDLLHHHHFPSGHTWVPETGSR